ncbi:seryl-tRNA synthetase [Whalleya microplaca]|nr:seryl-tRNA synthetase [Whalleya microplaca]
MKTSRPSLLCRSMRLRPHQCLRSSMLVRRLASSFITNSNNDIASPSDPSSEFILATLSSTAPRPNINIKHIRLNPELHRQNCLARKYPEQATYPALINEIFDKWLDRQLNGRNLRSRANVLRRQIAHLASNPEDEGNTNTTTTSTQSENTPMGQVSARDVKTMSRDELIQEAQDLKNHLAYIEADEEALFARMNAFALAMPNLTSEETPRGDKPRLIRYINDTPSSSSPSVSTPRKSSSSSSKSKSKSPSWSDSDADRVWRSHVHIGTELGLLDFAGAATASGWGWYYLTGLGAELEQALVSYALHTVKTQGQNWVPMTPPSMVYGHIAAACGFQPRTSAEGEGENHIYAIAQPASDPKPPRVLAGTAEIPLAGSKADAVLDAADLPLKRAGVSRCYRAEAGARGAGTKGLYRVHEFTKVELFAWTAAEPAAADAVFAEILDLQERVLGGLGLRCRVLEMPTADLGASAERKRDIEAWFPSRGKDGEDGWGEVTSASLCSDYQTRRLATRLRLLDNKMSYPYTVNGTAMAVPRVLAAVLENGWDEEEMAVTIPEVLRPWMDGREKITMEDKRR